MDWQSTLTRVVAWLTQAWLWLLTMWNTAQQWVMEQSLQSIYLLLSQRILNASPREQALALTALVVGIIILALVRHWQHRIYRDPALAQQALLADVSLLMTQLRGRARRPANATYRTLTRRIRRCRPAFDGDSWDRLWAQWKQADREVGQLLSTMRRSRSHVVRVEQYRHLSTLRDTLHAQVHVST
jgi:hypothetical protein